MASPTTIPTLASQEAIDYLVKSGMDRVHAEALMRPTRPTEQSSGTTAFEERMTRMMESFSQRLDQLTARVYGVSEVDETSTEITATPTLPRETPRNWADRPLDETPDYTTILRWPDDEEPAGQSLVDVSETTATFLTSSFTRPLANQARLSLKKNYAIPNVHTTKCPKLDRVMKSNVSKVTKDRDGTAAKLQTLMLDAVAPLVHILQKGLLTPEVAMKAAKVALGLIGNASAQQAKEQRKNVLKDMNKDVMPLAEEDDQFQGAAPLLFGEGFEKKMKEHVDAVRCLRKAGKPTESHFRRGRPHGTGYHRGGGNNRGRGRHRFHPYNNRSNGKENFQKKPFRPQSGQ